MLRLNQSQRSCFPVIGYAGSGYYLLGQSAILRRKLLQRSVASPSEMGWLAGTAPVDAVNAIASDNVMNVYIAKVVNL